MEQLQTEDIALRRPTVLAKLPKIAEEAELPLPNGTYTLRFDIGAIDAFETLRDMSIAEMFEGMIDPKTGKVILDEDGNPKGAKKIRVGLYLDLMWAGLLAHHHLTREEVGHLVGYGSVKEYIPYVMKALAAANQTNFPPEADVPGESKTAAKK